MYTKLVVVKLYNIYNKHLFTNYILQLVKILEFKFTTKLLQIYLETLRDDLNQITRA